MTSQLIGSSRKASVKIRESKLKPPRRRGRAINTSLAMRGSMKITEYVKNR